MKSIRLWNRGIAFLLSASLSLTPCFSWTGEVYAAVQEEETAPAASVHNEAEYVSEAASETEAETTGEEKETLPAVYEKFEPAAEEVGMEENPDMEVADRQAAEITDKKASSSNAEFDEDGYFYIVGRKKRFLKIYGNRVNLDEMERLLKERFSIDLACGGMDDKMYIFIASDGPEAEIKQFASIKTGLNQLAFKIVHLESIPRNESGKTVYKELEKYYGIQ